MRTKQPNNCFVRLKKLTVYPRSGKKSGEKYFFKVRNLMIVRELGNSVISQGILELSIKSGNFEITSQGKVSEI